MLAQILVKVLRHATWCELTLFSVAVVTGSVTLAQGPQPNTRCEVTTAPVTTCDVCPTPGNPNDRCEGTLPKQGTIYSDVTCQPEQNINCTPTQPGQGSPCGRIYMCPCVHCSNVFMGGCACTGPWTCEQKTCCKNKYGACLYAPY